MKQLTIAPRKDGDGHAATGLELGLPVHRGVAIPPHMRAPGEEGYRTPTVEDYETHHRESQQQSHQADRPLTGHSGTGLNGQPPRPFSARSFNLSNLNLSPRLLEKLEWRERVRHYTWTFFTMTMATGGIANVLYNVPFRFPGLEAIGVIFFLLNVVLFVINVTMVCLRFYIHSETFQASIMHPTERLFLPAAIVSFGTILINISQYGPSHAGHWLNTAVMVLFWFNCALALIAGMAIYLLMWSTKSFTIDQMTPIWIFPAYPMLIIGPHASVLSSSLEPERALAVIIGGFTIQGVGFLVTMMVYSAFIYRLMTQKLPQESSRPGMFVSVGPCGFTATAIIGMATSASRVLPPSYMGDGHLTAMILKVVASWMGLWIWGLGFWFFFISVGAHWSCVGGNKLTFAMNWFSFVFPNTALITATFAIGKAFNVKGIQILGCVMTVLLIILWFLVAGMMIRAIVLRQILWPQKGEDKDEGGFKGPRRKSSVLKSEVNTAMTEREKGGENGMV